MIMKSFLEIDLRNAFENSPSYSYALTLVVRSDEYPVPTP